jgi:hypothetical protein
MNRNIVARVSALLLTFSVAGCSSTSPEVATISSGSATGSTSSPPSKAAEAGAAASAQSTEKSGYKDILQAAAAKPAVPVEGDGWISLFDGKTLKGWKPTAFIGHGKVLSDQGMLIFQAGDPFTGVNWTDNVPRINYEISLDAMRVGGSDFFCGLTVPVKDSCCSLIVGGWGGSLIGISSLDGADASENETTKFINFENGRWYRIRLRVTDKRIEGWIDNEKLINLVTTDKRIAVRPGEIEMSQPFGLASWTTTAAFREINMRRIETPAGPAPKGF